MYIASSYQLVATGEQWGNIDTPHRALFITVFDKYAFFLYKY